MDLAPHLITAIASIIVAWLALKPRKTSRDEKLWKELDYAWSRVEKQTQLTDELAGRVAKLEDDRDTQRAEIRSLKDKVDDLWSRMRKVVDYARGLEKRITVLTGEELKRPEELKDIFDRH
ncbi:hypothetical protein ACIGDM_00930 [Rothia koreensis]|uniref:hypothetical protein n=1 Tax=Rothia koreensis TaxID=592378 RepID=UPI0037C69825